MAANLSPNQLLSTLSKERANPAHLAHALNLPLPKDSKSLSQFDLALAACALKSATLAVAKIATLMDSPKPQVAFRAAKTMLKLANHGHDTRPPKPPRKPAPFLTAAVIYLFNCLDPGPLPMTQLLTRARAAGISKASVLRAKTLLKIRSYRHHNQWIWTLPESAHLDPNPEQKQQNISPSSLRSLPSDNLSDSQWADETKASLR